MAWKSLTKGTESLTKGAANRETVTGQPLRWVTAALEVEFRIRTAVVPHVKLIA